jgi:hypothetical protein
MNLRLELVLLGVGALAASLLLPACDNPACGFGGTCTGVVCGGGGGGGRDQRCDGAVDHNWLSNGARADDHGVSSRPARRRRSRRTTPVVVVFSESMAASRLSNATIQLFQDLQISIPTPIYPPTLVGDGRVLLVMPIQPLSLDTPYKLQIATDEVIHDLQGTELARPTDGVIGRFTTAATNPATPKVVMTFPFDNSEQPERDRRVRRRLRPAHQRRDDERRLVRGHRRRSHAGQQSVSAAADDPGRRCADRRHARVALPQRRRGRSQRPSSRRRRRCR